ncbi:hypothetical protein KDY119_03172 [Luteimicrobium xylanilyticum]|uniref:DUF1684 domain-containing protein n=1 Tax=Luteimicrobium xylanilyticum TaxID=1133546 RepID=A0A5P9QE21_9MICO|nr:DUF1684 domain-containing protein [Luteimicrobium xylanilyticum]QFU99637.1 hypothetical protein KDY119_03172 [Luteimicrobium xylanilyticum]
MTTDTLDTAGPAATSDAADVAESAWRAWRAQRVAGLGAPRGVLSLTAHHWLGAEPASVDGVPGLWWADDDGAHVRPDDGVPAAAGHGAVLLDADTLRPVEDVRTVVVAEAGSAVPFLVGATGGATPRAAGADLVGVELALRTGRYLLRTRDPKAPALAAFVAAGDEVAVPAFAFDPAQVRDLPVRWYAEPRADVVDGAQPGVVHHVTVVGEVELDGATLGLVAGHQGGVTLSFTDRADGAPAWRAVHVPEADVEASRDGVLRVDLNRATAYPSHFNDHGTCPRPLAGNDVPSAVEAGEKDPLGAMDTL